MILHESETIPTLEQAWDKSDIDYVWFSWAEQMNGATMSSVWTIPAGWSKSGEVTDSNVTDSDGVVHANSNSALLTTNNEAGIYTITNTVTMSDGRVLERSIKIVVKDI